MRADRQALIRAVTRPLRLRVPRRINRLSRGDGADPFAVLAKMRTRRDRLARFAKRFTRVERAGPIWGLRK